MTLTVEEKFAETWQSEIEERRKRSPSFKPSEYTATGRAAAKYGGKRTEQWWLDNGPAMVQDWIDWREATGWEIPTIGGQPAVELSLTFEIPGVDMLIKGYIDRVFAIPSTRELAIVDLKGLHVDTPLATPTGWTTMGQVQVGDRVMGANGRATFVTAKSEVKWLDCYRVTFDDKTSIICDAEHLWETTTKTRRDSSTEVRAMPEIIRTLVSPNGQSNHRVAMPEALSLPEAELPIDPYVLGAWLGDGNRSRGVITKPDQELFDIIKGRGHAVGVAQIDRRTGVQSRTVLGLQTKLKAAGLHCNKHVPSDYLRSSVTQRLDLLRGLMDTDGTYNKRRRDVAFCTTDKSLAFAVEELVLTLGERARVFEVQRTGFGKTVTSYDVKWKPQNYNPFTLIRKADQVDMSKTSVRSRQRVIQKVEVIPSVATQCIAVDADDSLYLAGRQMVPTHNTGRTPDSPEQLGLYRVGLGIMYDIWPRWGYFWTPGKGHGQPINLEAWTPARFAVMFNNSINQVNAGAFNPNPQNNCKSWCGLARFCAAVGGELAAGVDSLAV